jgi:hypothetical protein
MLFETRESDIVSECSYIYAGEDTLLNVEVRLYGFMLDIVGMWFYTGYRNLKLSGCPVILTFPLLTGL